MIERGHLIRWFVWGLASLFLFYEYFLRTAPSVITFPLMETFAVTAGAIGTLSAFYFFIYAPMQIPVGLLMDRFGARRLLTLATTLCGLGGILFGLAPNYWTAAGGRFLMGFGSSFAFIGMVYVSAHWFRGEQLALLVGLGNSCASLGAVFGEGPLAKSVEAFGWRASIVGGGIFGLGLAIAMFFVLRREMPPRPRNHAPQEKRHWWDNLKEVIGSAQSWINACVALLTYGTTSAFAGLWGVPFLFRTHDMSLSEAGFAVSMIFVGWIVGAPLVGYLSDRLGNRVIVLRISLALAFLSLFPTIFFPGLPNSAVVALMFAIGFFSSAQILNFTLAIEIHPRFAKGTAVAFTNFLVAIVAALVQPLVGVILDLLAPQVHTIEGVPLYTPHEFRIALSVFPITMLLAFLGSFFIKPRPQPD